jgi:hypothetical protein
MVKGIETEVDQVPKQSIKHFISQFIIPSIPLLYMELQTPMYQIVMGCRVTHLPITRYHYTLPRMHPYAPLQNRLAHTLAQG